MADEIQGAITSDKVETDNTNFATVKADQTCEEALIPRENAFRQLTWQVTMEKGSVYNPPEEIGIYAEEVECKYGAQIEGDVFGRQGVEIEHGGAAHSESDGEGTIGARILGSVVSEGQIEVVAPGSKMEDFEERPVTIYGDVVGSHVSFERPTIVYGCVRAERTLRANAPTVVLGDVYSEGMIEASDLFAVSITGADDITLGSNVAVLNPTIRSETGSIHIADRVGLLLPEVFEKISAGNDLDAVGLWIFDVDAVWENALYPSDVVEHGDGQVADRAWRTVNELDEEYYADLRTMFDEFVESTRKNPPDIEEFRYAGVASLGELGGDTQIEGDVVVGTQEKTVEETEMTKIDQSTTEIDQSTEVNDQHTTVSDSVVKGSDVGSEEGSTEIEDSVVSDSSVGGEDRRSTVDSGGTTPDPEPSRAQRDPPAGGGGRGGSGGAEETKHCLYCGDEIPARAGHCPSCGEELPND
jgi:hypothetical protein